MITNVTLENFKCFRHLDIAPKLVTVLIGPNGTGKSGVLQALLLLKQSKDSVGKLALSGDVVQFAPEAFMLHGLSPLSDTVQLGLSGNWAFAFQGVEHQMEFEAHLSYSGDASLIDEQGRTKFCRTGQELEVIFGPNDRGYFTAREGTASYARGAGINDFEIVLSSGLDQDFLRFCEQVSRSPGDMMGNIKIVPAARALARGQYQLQPGFSVDISSTNGLGRQEEDIATTLAYSRPEVEKVSRLMKRVTGVGFRTDTVPPVSARPVSESPAGEFSLMAEGFGTNALVLLLFELVRAVPGATVLIEEPEVHLHPKAQADLASVLVEEAKADNKQVIMTTHSEHVVGRLLTLVAEGQLSPQEVAIYSFDKDRSGVCSAHEIEVTEHGQVKGGLKSFFETDLDEMRRYVDALRART